ncbi:hypothetical protein L208DRAFT_1033332, partial [Tricholoma matsutake]
WLSAPDTSRNYNEAFAKKRANTCSWFLTGTKFIECRKQAISFLGISGKHMFL